jgi:hypothetical protein
MHWREYLNYIYMFGNLRFNAGPMQGVKIRFHYLYTDEGGLD